MRKSLLGENRREAEGEGFNDDDDAVTFAFHSAAKERAPLLSGAALRGTMDDLIERNPLWTIAAHAVPTEPGADPTASPTRRPTIEVCLPPDPSLSQTHHADVMAALLGRHVPADAITHRSLLAARIASPASPARADQPSSGSPTRLRLSWGRRAPSRNRSQGRPPATPAPLLRLDGVDVGGLTAVTDLEADGVLSHLLTSSDYARGFLQVSTLPLLSSPFLSSAFADIRMHHVPFLSVPFLPLLSFMSSPLLLFPPLSFPLRRRARAHPRMRALGSPPTRPTRQSRNSGRASTTSPTATTPTPWPLPPCACTTRGMRGWMWAVQEEGRARPTSRGCWREEADRGRHGRRGPLRRRSRRRSAPAIVRGGTPRTTSQALGGQQREPQGERRGWQGGRESGESGERWRRLRVRRMRCRPPPLRHPPMRTAVPRPFRPTPPQPAASAGPPLLPGRSPGRSACSSACKVRTLPPRERSQAAKATGGILASCWGGR